MILIYTPYFYPEYVGGAERLAFYTAKGLQNIGEDVCILTLGKKNNQYQYENLDVFALSTFEHEQTVNLNYDDVISLLNKIKPDFIHIVGLAAITNLINVAKERNIKLGMAGMDYTIPCDNRALIRGNMTICSGRLSMDDCFSCTLESKRIKDRILAKIGKYSPKTINKALKYFGTFLYKREFGNQLDYWYEFNQRESLRTLLKNSLNLFFAPTDFTKKVVKDYFSSSNLIILKLMYPLPKEFCITNKLTNKDSLTVGYIGRAIPIKGMETLLSAIGKIDKEYDIYYKIYCPENDEFVNYRKELKIDFNKYPNVKWYDSGLLEISDLKEIHSNIDVLVVPSIWQEYLGFVTIEALRLGTTVILSDFDSHNHFVKDKNNGLLFTSGNSTHLSKKIVNLYKEKINFGLAEPNINISSIEEYSKNIINAYNTIR